MAKRKSLRSSTRSTSSGKNRKRREYPVRQQVKFTLDERRTYTLMDQMGVPGGRITKNDIPKGRKTSRLPYNYKGKGSSNVAKVEYNNSTSVMTVTYDRRAGRAVYEYYGVPLALFRRFRKVQSAGKFVWNNIRRPPPTQYPYMRTENTRRVTTTKRRRLK